MKWLRYVENLGDIELVCICEPEVGETLSDEEGRSVKGFTDCQEGRDEFSNFQVGNEMTLVDLINCEEGRGEIPNFQVGKGEEMNLVESSYQQGVLTKRRS